MSEMVTYEIDCAKVTDVAGHTINANSGLWASGRLLLLDGLMLRTIARGVAWLDTTLPDWFERINTDELSMRHGDSCIMGHVGKAALRSWFGEHAEYDEDGSTASAIDWQGQPFTEGDMKRRIEDNDGWDAAVEFLFSCDDAAELGFTLHTGIMDLVWGPDERWNYEGQYWSRLTELWVDVIEDRKHQAMLDSIGPVNAALLGVSPAGDF